MVIDTIYLTVRENNENKRVNATTCMLNILALLAVVIKTYTYCDSQTLNFSLREDSG